MAEGVFDGFGHAPLSTLTWGRPDERAHQPGFVAFDGTTPIDGGNPARMVFVMHAECTFLPRELASLHALGMGLRDEWALAPYGIDDATDAFFERRLVPKDFLWLAADNLNALVWGLHDWAHFHNHGPFEERAMTELQCDVSALVWLLMNRDAIGLAGDALDRVIAQMKTISKARFESEGKPFTAPYFDRRELEKLCVAHVVE